MSHPVLVCCASVRIYSHEIRYIACELYVVVQRNRLRCTTTLVVFTDSEEVARWASQPIDVGCGMVMRPIVIGPRQIPSDLSIELSRKVPALAVLAVVAHGRGPEAERVGRMALEVTRPLVTNGDERAMLYTDVIFAYLDEAVLKKILEDEMNLGTQPISSYFKRHRAEGRAEGQEAGRAEGMARMLERLLERRGFELSSQQRRHMAACEDEVMLQHWFDRAIMATRVAEIFDV